MPFFLQYYIVNNSVIFRIYSESGISYYLHVVFQIQVIIFSHSNYCICLLTCLPTSRPSYSLFSHCSENVTLHTKILKRIKSKVFIVANDVLCLPTRCVSPLCPHLLPLIHSTIAKLFLIVF